MTNKQMANLHRQLTEGFEYAYNAESKLPDCTEMQIEARKAIIAKWEATRKK